MNSKDCYRRSFTDEYGKRHWVRGATIAEAERKREDLKRQVRDQLFIPDASTTVVGWIADYIKFFIQPQVSSTWAAEIERILTTRVLPDLGAMKLTHVRPLHLQKIQNDASDMSYSYRYKLTLELKRLFRIARQNQLIQYDPAEGLRLPSRNDEQIGRALTDAERTAIEGFLGKHRFGLPVALMLYAGLRDQEVIALTKGQIRLAEREIIIDRAAKHDGTIGAPKSKAGIRKVPLRDALVPLLEGHLAGDPDDPLCTQTRGGRYGRTSYRKGWQSFLNELNISLGATVFRNQLVPPLPVSDDIKPYYLRHTFCTDCERAGIPVQVTARIMGHSSTSVTLRYYTHPTRTVHDMALAALNGAGWHAGVTPDRPK